jgi:hypothetical protein
MMLDNCEIVDATLQAVDNLQTNIQTYVTNKTDPPPTVESGLQKSLILGMLATETRMESQCEADDEAESAPSSPGSPGEISPVDFQNFEGEISENAPVEATSDEVVVSSDPADVGVVTEDVVVTPDPAPKEETSGDEVVDHESMI